MMGDVGYLRQAGSVYKCGEGGIGGSGRDEQEEFGSPSNGRKFGQKLP